MYWFSADEHYGHKNIIKYCKRPFNNIEEMDEILILNFNSVVGKNDTTIHAGDFTLIPFADKVRGMYVSRLNGNHIFVKGSHDRWLQHAPFIIEKTINKQFIVVCHYAMRVWHRSHFNSWQLYGHSHGNLPPVGKQHDIGVDNNNFFPVSFDEIKEIMKTREDNFNLVRRIEWMN